MATALQPTFGLQQPEDSMEISSEYGNMDADIDIDLDAPDAVDTNMHSFQQQSFQQDDHHMQEDPKSDRLDDDLMIDDSNLDDPDRIMQDDAPVPQEQDEELLDFSEDEEDVPMNAAEHTEPESHLEPQYQAPIEQSAPVEEPVEHVQSEVASELLTKGVQPVDNTATQTEDTQQQSEAQQPIRDQDATNEKPENVAQAQSTHEVTSEPQPETQEEAQPSPAADSAEQTKPSAHETVIESTEFPNATNDNVDESAHAAHPTENEHKEQGNDNVETGVAQEADEESFQPSLTRQETDLSNYTVPEDYSRERQANSPTVTGLHPTIVEYQENEVYLFPSRDPAVPEQYLLQNENLVTTSLGDLLQACRTALGDGISEDEELVLGVEELDLYVSEVSFEHLAFYSYTATNNVHQDSTPAFSTSFSELLDMYLKLHRLDGNDNPPPFRVSLTTKTRFSNRMAAITQAISEGKGFSQLSFLQYYEYDEPTELPDEDFDDDFDELAKPDEQQHLIENGRQAATEEEHTTEDHPAPQAEEQHHEQTDPAQHVEGQVGEYEGESSVQHDAPADAFDQSEYTQDETQYFDAQGDESELVGETGQDDHSSAAPHSTTGDAGAVVQDEVHHDEQSHDDNAQHDQASEHVTQEESPEEPAEIEQQHANGEEESLFGQGEFFDENYDYQDGEVNEVEDAHAHEEQVVDDDSHFPAEEDAEASAAEAQHDPAATSSEGSAQAQVSETEDGSAQDAEQLNVADELVTETEPVAENGSTTADTIVGQATAKRHSPRVEDDDYEEINFDDEDEEGYGDDGAGLAPVLTNTSSKASPGGKRSFSELDQVDDEQDNKKARAS